MKYNNIFSIPVSRKRQTSMRRRFIVFSSILFLLIFIPGSVTFIILMDQIQFDNAGHKLMQTIEIERLKLEASINSEIAIALRMADSPLIQWHFLNPEDEDIKQIALGEIAGYRRAFTGKNVFWVGDKDKKYYFNNEYVYTIDPSVESSWWYNSIMKSQSPYSLNVNFDVGLKRTMVWVNAPVPGNDHKPVGIVGTGINVSDFINAINYNNSDTEDELYFFNAAGEIIKAKSIDLVEKKANITGVLGVTGYEILDRAKEIKTGEIGYFKTKTKKQIIAITSIPISAIPALNWYIIAVRPVTIADFLHTGMAILFGIMMTVIMLVFVLFNIFITIMLEPLNQIVKTINQTFAEWELNPKEGEHHKDEVGTFREFFHLTIIDQLTGVYNRRYLDGSLKKIIKFHSRTGSNLSVLLLDIDYFKKYNDTYGHGAGDDCLRAVASALSQCVIRDEDFVARYGGEEFAVVLPNTDESGAHLVAERMLGKIRECNIPHKASDIADYVTISIGGTTDVINHLQHGNDYIKLADGALYESKKNGRNRYTFIRNRSE
ncbi:MAG: diguanylate cyclase [Treponema sp.]|jgi:diguanylate cyclase (GGDEF)-like protein|nr:diguanylate cyclase [Treponema sp.]